MSFAEPSSPSPSGPHSTAASSPPRRPTRRPEDLRSGLTLGAPPGSLSKMTLEDWLKQDRGLADQLKVIEGLCSALNGAHQRREVHRALHPGNIEVASDGTCDLSEAVSGPLSPRYRAPEVVDGGPPSAESDIYAAGVIFYELLSGRSPSGERPTPLSDLRQDVSRDLTDAIMGCLERGPDWRPKDLSYLLQVVASMRNAGAKSGGRAAARAPEPARMGPSRAGRKAARGSASKSNVPLYALAVLLVAGAGAGLWWYFNQGHDGGVAQADAAARSHPDPHDAGDACADARASAPSHSDPGAGSDGHRHAAPRDSDPGRGHPHPGADASPRGRDPAAPTRRARRAHRDLAPGGEARDHHHAGRARDRFAVRSSGPDRPRQGGGDGGQRRAPEMGRSDTDQGARQHRDRGDSGGLCGGPGRRPRHPDERPELYGEQVGTSSRGVLLPREGLYPIDS